MIFAAEVTIGIAAPSAAINRIVFAGNDGVLITAAFDYIVIVDKDFVLVVITFNVIVPLRDNAVLAVTARDPVAALCLNGICAIAARMVMRVMRAGTAVDGIVIFGNNLIRMVSAPSGWCPLGPV